MNFTKILTATVLSFVVLGAQAKVDLSQAGLRCDLNRAQSLYIFGQTSQVYLDEFAKEPKKP